MKNAMITGATGMVGGLVLQHCLRSEGIRQMTSLVRRPSGVTHPKLLEVICRDIADYTGLETHFTHQDIAFFCTGAYTGTVPDDEFRGNPVLENRAIRKLVSR